MKAHSIADVIRKLDVKRRIGKQEIIETLFGVHLLITCP